MIEVGHCRNDIGQYDGPSVMLAYRTLILQGDIPLDQGCIATSQLTVFPSQGHSREAVLVFRGVPRVRGFE
jgi:hypothetical protein